MRKMGITLSVAGLAFVGACSRSADSRPDDALKNDLALAAQVQPYQAQQFVTPSEQQMSAYGTARQYNAVARNPQPVNRAPAPVNRAPARRTSSRPSSSRGSSSGTYYPSAPSAPQEPVRNTGRDAAIGAVAGAVIGATTSRDKVKGGLIGAAAGGILGGIIGHTVDIQKP
jgi:Glycine zipper